MTPRKAITDRMKWQSCLFWAELRCPECDVILNPEDDIEWDHAHALAFDGPHHHANIRPMHTNCHTQKTIRDVKALAKVKRLEKKRNGEAKPKKPWPKSRKKNPERIYSAMLSASPTQDKPE